MMLSRFNQSAWNIWEGRTGLGKYYTLVLDASWDSAEVPTVARIVASMHAGITGFIPNIQDKWSQGSKTLKQQAQ
jgi:hypothetical protein